MKSTSLNKIHLRPCEKSQGPSLSFSFFTSNTHIEQIKIEISSSYCYALIGPDKLQGLIEEWLLAYAQKKEGPSLPLLFSGHTRFQHEVLTSMMKIPFGTVLSYSELAAMTSSPKASRAAGTVCKSNAYPLVIPCHRVIQASGKLGEYNGGVQIKKRLLQHEGAFIS